MYPQPTTQLGKKTPVHTNTNTLGFFELNKLIAKLQEVNHLDRSDELMKHRDNYGIITQNGDGGDSAFSTGMMALAGSTLDQDLLPMFITNNFKVIRHPHQDKWNMSHLTSRDQVVAYFGGVGQLPSQKRTIEMSITALEYIKNMQVNKDILLPHVLLFLYKAAGLEAPLRLKIWGYPFMLLSILWDAYIKPNHEMNQSVAMALTFGKFWIRLLNKLHPNLQKNILDYYSGWRDKREMGVAIVNRIEEAL